MNMEQNKIFAALLLAGIIAMVSGIFADGAIHSEDLEKPAYVIEVADAGTATPGADAKPKGAEPIADLLATADLVRGKKLSKACAACHTFDKGGAKKTGPNLWNIVGRQTASADFAYSSAMKEKSGNWTTDELNSFLWKPKKAVVGTKMNYIGMRKTKDRAALIAWLDTLK